MSSVENAHSLRTSIRYELILHVYLLPLNLLLIVAAEKLENLKEVNLGPRSRESVVVKTVVEPTLYDLYQDISERFVHVSVFGGLFLRRVHCK